MVLPIKGCDVVLGIQWLLTLGSTVWNFAELIMQFKHLGKTCILQGLVPEGLHMVTGAQLSKSLNVGGQGLSSMLLAISEHTALSLPKQTHHPDIERLLREFEDIFQALKGLPPIKL